jgi:hypothetical protein
MQYFLYFFFVFFEKKLFRGDYWGKIGHLKKQSDLPKG